MAKDELGHGSNQRGTGAQGMRLVKTHVNGPHSAKVYKNPEWEENVVKFFRNGAYQPKADYHTNDMGDAHDTAKSALQRYATQDAQSRPVGDRAAASALSTSGSVPVHDSMAGLSAGIARGHAMRTAGDGGHVPGYNEHGSRHGYSPDAVNNAIAAQNRSGRGKIGGREAKMIHALLKGR